MNWMGKSGSFSSPIGLQPPRFSRKRLIDLPNLIDDETGWYQSWYFRARLDDLVARARAKGHELTVVWARMPLSKWGDGSRLRNYAIIRLGLIEREERPVDLLFGRLSEDEFAICVYGTEELLASMAAEKALRQLSSLAIDSDLASFPSDGRDSESLLARVRSGMSTPSNLVDFEAYRQRRGPRAA